jgi:alkylhydroperoxidase family enzyme
VPGVMQGVRRDTSSVQSGLEMGIVRIRWIRGCQDSASMHSSRGGVGERRIADFRREEAHSGLLGVRELNMGT